MMLQMVPTNWYSWNFTVTAGSRTVADIAMSWWREKGRLTVDGETYRLYREAPMSGAFVLEHAGSVLARAEKPSVFFREFAIDYAGRALTLRPTSMFRRAFALLDGPREVGSVAPENAFTRKAAADLPDDLPLPVRAFIVWLVAISWKREQES